MRILVTGISGQLGSALLQRLAPLGEVIGVDRQRMDLMSADAIRDCMREVRPDLVINPAAWTAVDLAESEPDAAMQVNAIAPGVLAEACASQGAWLIHYSTDYVFDGGGTRAWREDDPTHPTSVYGRSKLAGEQAVAASGCRHLILRTSWVYSLKGRNFLTTMFRLASERPELRVVDDQIGAPTTSLALASATVPIVQRMLAPRAPDSGIYHVCCAGEVSWCGFAAAIFDRLPAVAHALGQPAPRHQPTLIPITTADYPTPASRPHNSRLDTSRLADAFGVRLPDWERALDDLLAAPG